MAVGAYRCVTNPLITRFLMYTVECFFVLTGMTAEASVVKLERKIPTIGVARFGVGVVANICMALDASVAPISVHGLKVLILVDIDRHKLAVVQDHQEIGIAVALETSFVANALSSHGRFDERGRYGGN
jgi:hypothetical protein